MTLNSSKVHNIVIPRSKQYQSLTSPTDSWNYHSNDFFFKNSSLKQNLRQTRYVDFSSATDTNDTSFGFISYLQFLYSVFDYMTLNTVYFLRKAKIYGNIPPNFENLLTLFVSKSIHNNWKNWAF